MKKVTAVLILLLVGLAPKASAYTDHRGHNLDSLERAVAVWTPTMIDNASDDQLAQLISAWDELMMGYSSFNGAKCNFYAYKVLSLAVAKGWGDFEYSAYKMIGQSHWAEERYDSAAFYYKKTMEAIDRMAAGEKSPLAPEEITQKDIDDERSLMYGTLGNLYSSQDSIAKAMEYYERAGELFKKYNWNVSCSVLYNNMGATWLNVGELGKARKCFDEALEYSVACNDSLWQATAYRGLGQIYLEQGKLSKAQKYLKESDEYFSKNQREDPFGRIETLDVMGRLAERQRQNLFLYLLLSAIAIIFLISFSVGQVRLRRAQKQNKEASEFIEETLVQMPATAETTGKVKLNDREIAIIKMIAEGKESAEMAETLHLSAETIKWYRKRLLVKFDVTTSTALTTAAIKQGLL